MARRTRGCRRWTIFALVLCAAAAGPASPRAESQTDAGDDGYHLSEWADGSHDGDYTEWWYFNFFDAARDVQGIVSYFVSNPEDRLGSARVQIAAVAWTPSGIVTEIDAWPIGEFRAAAGTADVTIGPNAIRVVDDATDRVTGASIDGRLSWDLSFARQAAPWLGGDRIPVGSLPWESMSWRVDMPRARVTGHLVVDGRDFTIDAPGYHDHNWGEWIPPHALWNWAQFSDDRVAIELGDFIGRESGILSIDVGGTRATFAKGEYSLVHTRWGWDPANRVFYPTETLLTARNDDVGLTLSLRALRTEPLRGRLPFPLRDLIIYEQTARFEGVVRSKDASGRWRIADLVRGPGFKEYTAARY